MRCFRVRSCGLISASWYKPTLPAFSPRLRHPYSSHAAVAAADHPTCFASATRRLAGDAAFMDVDLGVRDRLDRLDALESNVHRRGLALDVRKLNDEYRRLQNLLSEKKELERKREENADIMKSLIKENKLASGEKEEVIKRGKIIKTKLKQLLEGSYRDLEKEVMSEVLRLPVDIHPLTPNVDADCLIEEGSVSKRDFQFEALNHLELGCKRKSIILRSGVSGDAYYLAGDLAMLERSLVNGLVDKLQASDLQHVICPDMVKPFIAESFDVDHLQNSYCVEGKPVGPDPSAIRRGAVADRFPPKNAAAGNKADVAASESIAASAALTLTGVSPLSFAASLCYMNVLSSSLPIKQFSVGTSYSPLSFSSSNFGLYTAPQSIATDLFGAARDSVGMDSLFDEFSAILLSVYRNLGLPYRLVRVRAKELLPVESRRMDLLIWSPGFKQYFKCGSLSAYDDVIGRRLTMKHASDIEHLGSRNFLHTVHCRVMRVSSVIASVMEHSQHQDGTYRINLERNLEPRITLAQSS